MAVNISYITEVVYTQSFYDRQAIANYSWTDISSYVRDSAGCEIRRGRGDEMTEISPGTMTITLDNSTGRFTPGNPAAVGLDLGCPIRRTCNAGGNIYRRFVGYIDSIQIPDWSIGPFDKVVVIEASDRLARLGSERTGLMLSTLDYEMLSPGPSLYWPMTEDTESKEITSIAYGRTDPLRIVNNAGELRFGEGPPVPSSGQGTPKFECVFNETGALVASSDYFRTTSLAKPIKHNGAGQGVYVTAWLRLERAWSVGPVLPIVWVMSDNSGNQFSLRLDANRTLIAQFPGTTITGPVIADTNALYCVLVEAEAGTSGNMQVNGIQYNGSGTVTSSPISFTNFQVGGPWHGTISHVAIYEGYNMGYFLAYYTGITAYDGRYADSVVKSVAYYSGVDYDDVMATPDAQTRVGTLPITGRSATDIFNQMAKAENGYVFVAKDGKIVFHTRARRWEPGSAPTTLTVPNPDIAGTIGISYTDKYMINRATVKRPNGTTATATDSASQRRHGTYGDERELPFWTDAECAPRARVTVRDYSEPGPRIGNLSVRIITAPDPQSILWLEIGDVIILTGLSADAPSNLSYQWIEGISETQSADDYVITFSTSPELSSEKVNYWAAGDTYGMLVAEPFSMKIAP